MHRTLSIGPLNSASQATAWAEAVSHRTADEAFTLAFDGPLARLTRDRRMIDVSDRAIPHYRLSPSWWRRARVRHILSAATHHLNESNMPLMSDPTTRRFTDEVDEYRRRGMTSGVVFHGSDARDPQLSIDLNRHSYFTDADPAWAKQLGERARHNRDAVARAGLQTFVTTPDMLQQVAGSRLLPLTLSLDEWRQRVPPMSRRVPRVVHRPASKSATKGTPQIMEVLTQLELEGKIEIVRSDVVSHKSMPALFASADLVIDQIRSGAYGVTAIEAMAAGRVVIAQISEQTRQVLGSGLPIVDADSSTLRESIENLLGDREQARRIAAAGPVFVQEWHDGRAAAHALQAWMEGAGEDRGCG